MKRLTLALLLVSATGCRKPEAEKTTGDAASTDAAPTSSGPAIGIPLPSASVAATLNPNKLPAYSGPTGSLEGTVYVKGDAAPDVAEDFSKCPSAVKTYGKLFREGPPRPNGERPLADAILGVTGYSDYYIPETREAKLVTIQDCAFTSRTIDLTYGQRLEIANKERVLFAPALSGIHVPAVMLAPPGGDAVRLYPPKPGYYKITDRFDAVPIRADLYVVPQPLHAVSDVVGHYRIDGIPAKTKLTVHARLAALGETSKEFEVLPGVVQTIDLTLTYSSKSDAGVTKNPADGGFVPPR